MSVYIWCHNASEHLLSRHYTSTVTISVYTWCHSASEHLLSQSQCASGVTVPVNIYCHNVSIHLLSHYQCTPGATMPVKIYCHNVGVYVVSQFLLSVCMSITLLLITILYSQYIRVLSKDINMFSQLKKVWIKVDGFYGSWICCGKMVVKTVCTALWLVKTVCTALWHSYLLLKKLKGDLHWHRGTYAVQVMVAAKIHIKTMELYHLIVHLKSQASLKNPRRVTGAHALPVDQ